MPLFHPRKCPLSLANEVIPLRLLFLPRTMVRINKQAFAKRFVILWVKGLYKGEMLPLIHLVLTTRRSDCSCMHLLGCERVWCVVSTERGSCLHSPTMTRTRIISHSFGIEAWLGLACQQGWISGWMMDSWGLWHVKVLGNQSHWGLQGGRKSTRPWCCEFDGRVGRKMGEEKEEL